MKVSRPMEYDPQRARELLNNQIKPPEPAGATHTREEQLRQLGFEDDADNNSDNSDDNNSDASSDREEGGLYQFSGVNRNGNGSNTIPVAKYDQLNAVKQRLERTVATLEQRLETEKANGHAAIGLLKAAEDQVVMLTTSSQQQLKMLKRERELIRSQAAEVRASVPKTTPGDDETNSQRVGELEAENRQLKAQLVAVSQSPKEDFERNAGNADGALMTSQLAAQAEEMKQQYQQAENFQNEITALKQKNQALQKSAASSVSELGQSSKQLESELGQTHKVIEQLQSEVEHARSASMESNAAMQQKYEGETQRLNQEVVDLRAQIARVATEAEQYVKAQMTGLEASLVERDIEIERLVSASDAATRATATYRQQVEDNREEMERLREGYQTMADKYTKESKLRRQLHNTLADLKGRIRVFCRVRPLSAKERAASPSDAEEVVMFPEDDTIALRLASGVKNFEFDRVFNQVSGQADVFVDTSPLVTSVLDGFNVCIFAYGQTGSGKTHTMEGPKGDPGVNSRALEELFRLINERGADFQISITASLLEIYNETIRDLLVPQTNQKLEVRQGPDGVYVPDLTLVEVSGPLKVDELIDTGKKNRTTFATSMNEHSSRSHSILSVFVTSKNLVSGATSKGKLHLVDLAGSERISKTEASGDRLKEAQAINKSLSALGDVIAALTANSAHTPYRNSKLTYLLQDSLGGDSKTMMFVNINPAAENQQESVCSLNFAQRVRKVEKGQATKNVVR